MYLVTYDIASDKIRKKISDKLKGYGNRIQYSAFECDITAAKFKKLYKELEEIVEGEAETHIRVYYLDKNAVDSIIVLGDADYIGDAQTDVIFV